MGAVVYNEIDAHAAEWIGNLVRAGHVANGRVDSRSIVDLRADDVRDAAQFHAFAGIGGWSHALRLAGWPDDRPVWTGSCPCQSFSAAGRGAGFSDERHLWPEWFRLIRECRPPVIFGEQVASPAGLKWLDLVSADLEGAGYAVGAADLCAAGVGAPHIRQRLYFVAVADGLERRLHLPRGQARRADLETLGRGEAGDVADAVSAGRSERWSESRNRSATGSGIAVELGDAGRARGGRDAGAVPRAQGEGAKERRRAGRVVDQLELAGATRGFWRDADWLYCRDGKARPVEPGTFPLAHGVPGRVGKLRAYGNAIVPQVAAEFIRAVMEVL